MQRQGLVTSLQVEYQLEHVEELAPNDVRLKLPDIGCPMGEVRLVQINSMYAYDQAGKPARCIVLQVPATCAFAQTLANLTAQALPMTIGNKAYQWHHHTT